jgi:hypothetical protein
MRGRGVLPPPSLLFFKWGVPSHPCAGATGGYPLRAWSGFLAKIRENPQTLPITPAIPREPQDSAMQKNDRFATMGGGG